MSKMKYLYFIITDQQNVKQFKFPELKRFHNLSQIILSISRSHWPRGLRRKATAARLLDRGFEFHRGHGCLSFVRVVCCQVEVSATS
jgi:hypothetical protein